MLGMRPNIAQTTHRSIDRLPGAQSMTDRLRQIETDIAALKERTMDTLRVVRLLEERAVRQANVTTSIIARLHTIERALGNDDTTAY